MRSRIAYTLVALIAAGLVVAATGLGRSGGATAAHKRAAIRDSSRLLAGVVPPPGAVRLSKRNAVGIQRRVRLLNSAFASAVASERWSVRGQAGAVLSYVESHLPSGSKVFSTGSGGPPPGEQSVIRAWAPVSGILDTRWLEISVSARSTNETDLVAESQSQWVVARPARERIPAGVTEADFTKGLPGRPPQFSRAVTAPGIVRKLVTLFNSLGIVQPVVINCPAETVTPIVTVAFRGATGGPALAVATGDARADLPWPDSVPGWACVSIGFSVRGRTFDSLIGNVISPIDRLLHVHLERS